MTPTNPRPAAALPALAGDLRTSPAPPPPEAAAVPVTGLSPAQLPRAARVVARAFVDDPVMEHVFPDPATRTDRIQVVFTTLMRFALRKGAVWTTPGSDGATIWIGPGNFPNKMSDLLRAGLGGWPLAFGGRTFVKAMKVMGWMDELHQHARMGRHWHFWVIGVDPDLHHQGLGTRLLQHGLQRSDAEGLPSYCETFRPRMVPYLRRFGYEVIEEADAPGGGPHMWTLQRPARTPHPPARRNGGGP